MDYGKQLRKEIKNDAFIRYQYKRIRLLRKCGYRVPKYNRKKMVTKPWSPPSGFFGAGNIFRAFQANVIEQLLNKGVLDRGLIVAEGYDYEIIDKIYHPYDNHSILVTLKTDGTVEKSVIGSVAESLVLDSENLSAFSRSAGMFSERFLQIASFTITEKVISFVSEWFLSAKT